MIKYITMTLTVNKQSILIIIIGFFTTSHNTLWGQWALRLSFMMVILSFLVILIVHFMYNVGQHTLMRPSDTVTWTDLALLVLYTI